MAANGDGSVRASWPEKIGIECSKCGLTDARDLGDHYLMYPKTNEPIKFGFYCQNEDCQHEWSEQIILRVTVGRVPTPSQGQTE